MGLPSAAVRAIKRSQGLSARLVTVSRRVTLLGTTSGVGWTSAHVTGALWVLWRTKPAPWSSHARAPCSGEPPPGSGGAHVSDLDVQRLVRRIRRLPRAGKESGAVEGARRGL